MARKKYEWFKPTHKLYRADWEHEGKRDFVKIAARNEEQATIAAKKHVYAKTGVWMDELKAEFYDDIFSSAEYDILADHFLD